MGRKKVKPMARKASGDRFPTEKVFYRTVETFDISALIWDGQECKEVCLENKVGKSPEKIVKASLNDGEKLLMIKSAESTKRIAYMEIEDFLKVCKFRELDAETKNQLNAEYGKEADSLEPEWHCAG